MKEFRPWGSYEVLAEGEGYKVKRITVNAGGILSLQYHNHRREFWTVVEGKGTVTVGDTAYPAESPMTFDIAVGQIHRAASDSGMTFIEVQYGSPLIEEDIVRLEDKYNRIPNE